jgi:hypothetical protein
VQTLTRRSESSTTPQRGHSWISVVVVGAIVSLMPVLLVFVGLLLFSGPFSGRRDAKDFQEFIATDGAPMFVVAWWGWLAALAVCGMFVPAGVVAVRLLERFVSGVGRPLLGPDDISPDVIMRIAFVLSLASPVVLFGLIGVTAYRVTMTTLGAAGNVYVVLALAQLGVYLTTMGWFVWHRHWRIVAAMLVLLIPLGVLEVLTCIVFGPSAFFNECFNAPCG